MPQYLGFQAWLRDSQGRFIPEVTTKCEGNTITCSVGVQVGTTFSVNWKDEGSMQHSAGYISVDGVVTPGRFLEGSGETFRTGFRTGFNTQRPFMFSDIYNGDAPKSPVGTIELKIRLIEAGGELQINTNIIDRRRDIPGGRETAYHPLEPYTRQSKPLHPSAQSHVKFCFQYCSPEIFAMIMNARVRSNNTLRIYTPPTSGIHSSTIGAPDNWTLRPPVEYMTVSESESESESEDVEDDIESDDEMRRKWNRDNNTVEGLSQKIATKAKLRGRRMARGLPASPTMEEMITKAKQDAALRNEGHGTHNTRHNAYLKYSERKRREEYDRRIALDLPPSPTVMEMMEQRERILENCEGNALDNGGNHQKNNDYRRSSRAHASTSRSQPIVQAQARPHLSQLQYQPRASSRDISLSETASAPFTDWPQGVSRRAHASIAPPQAQAGSSSFSAPIHGMTRPAQSQDESVPYMSLPQPSAYHQPPFSSNGDGDGRNLGLRCEACRKRKVRCDGKRPECTSCVKSRRGRGIHHECHYTAEIKRRELGEVPKSGNRSYK